jgi:hypothetical protein
MYYEDLLRRVFAGRKVVLATDVLAAAPGAVRLLKSLGAQRPLIISGSSGTGDPPPAEDAECVVLGTSGDSVMGSIRAFETALRDLPKKAGDVLARFDPHREAIVLGTLFTRGDEPLWGRRVYGGRPREWEALEDKLVVDQLFDEAKVARAPSAIVSVLADPLRAAAAGLDLGHGTAWAGDAREGFWGGAEYFRWVRNDDDLTDAQAFFAQHCDRVRVMPFLEGIPCSIHGIVFDHDVIAFRPVEMLTLRRLGSNKMLYAGLATFWDPTDADREQMRTIVHRVGDVLRSRVDYRGAFTLDGVMTADGFRPTELNPRAGAGLGPQAVAAGLSLGMLNRLIVEREPFDYKNAELEKLVVSSADANRGGACYTVLSKTITTSEDHSIVEANGGYQLAGDGQDAAGTLTLGPSGVGGFVRFTPDPNRTPVGPSFAPRGVEAFAFADEKFGTGLGALEAARPVR